VSPLVTLCAGAAAVMIAPLIGGLIAGVDRKLSARMQSRWGPPLLQPFYDVAKLFQKETIVVRRSQNFYVYFFFAFIVFTTGLFFTGSDILLTIFALTLADIFLVLAAYKASSPYSFIGAERELILMMAYEPMLLLTAVGMYLVTRSFYVADIMLHSAPLVLSLPGLFIGYVFILVFKMRKSPFDLSSSHHAHQEIVRGITTEFSGKTLALIEVAHWYETMVFLGMAALFFTAIPWLAAVAVALVFFIVILVDNVFARVRWQLALSSAWITAAALGVGNILVVYFLR
jgi:ech hydrogenase subunit B